MHKRMLAIRKWIDDQKLPDRIRWWDIPKMVTVILLVLPILSQFRFWPISSFGVLELACVLMGGGYLAYCFLLKEKLVFGPFLLFYALCAVGVIVSAFVYGEGIFSMGLSAARLVLLYLAFFCSAPRFFDYGFAKRWYVRIALAACAGVIVQVIAYYVFGNTVFLIPHNMTLNYADGMNSSDLIQSLTESVTGGYYFRPSSFFIEPAYLSSYVLPSIALVLFDGKQGRAKDLACAAFLSVAILLTTSTISLVITVAIWGLYFLMVMRRLPREKRKKFLWIIGGAVAVLAVVLMQGAVGASLLRKINQLLSLDSATKFNSTSLRLLRGFHFFAAMDWLPQLIGCGFSHIADYYHLAEMQLALDYAGLQVDYMNSVGAILCSTGLLGAAIFVASFVKLAMKRNPAATALCLVFLLMMISSSYWNTPDYFLLLVFLMTMKEKTRQRVDHNRLKKDIERGSRRFSKKPKGEKIGVVVLNYNNSPDAIQYVNAIRDYESIDHIVMVDNCSTDDSVQQMQGAAYGKVDLIESGKNGGYGFGNNCGVRYLREKYGCKYVLITNPDVQYKECVVLDCAQFLHDYEREGYAVVAPTMVNLNGSIGETAWPIPNAANYYLASLMFLGKLFTMESVDILEHRGESFVPCDCVAGSMLMVNSDRFAEVGMYDEDIFLFCEETTLGIRMKKYGYKTAVLPDSFFIHAHSTSINKSIKSRVSRLNIMWKSRLHVLKTYYGYQGTKLAFAQWVRDICIWETKVISMIKKR